MTTDDNVANALAELDAVLDFEKRYKPGDFVFRETFGHLVRSIRYLAAEVEALRDDD